MPAHSRSPVRCCSSTSGRTLAPAPDVVQDFKAAAVHLLERFVQDTPQSVRKRESWARIVHLVYKTAAARGRYCCPSSARNMHLSPPCS